MPATPPVSQVPWMLITSRLINKKMPGLSFTHQAQQWPQLKTAVSFSRHARCGIDCLCGKPSRGDLRLPPDVRRSHASLRFSLSASSHAPRPTTLILRVGRRCSWVICKMVSSRAARKASDGWDQRLVGDCRRPRDSKGNPGDDSRISARPGSSHGGPNSAIIQSSRSFAFAALERMSAFLLEISVSGSLSTTKFDFDNCSRSGGSRSSFGRSSLRAAV